MTNKIHIKPLLGYNTVFEIKNIFSGITNKLHTSCV